VASSSQFHAPILSSPDAAGAVANSSDFPVVLMHGLGDAGDNPGMQSLAASIEVRRFAICLPR